MMPALGDQHKPNGNATSNPFEETKQHISEYTAQEIATLQSRLNKRLGPEFISTRPGPGNQKIAYLPAEKAINLANEVFGFNGWSSSIQNIQIDFVEENATTGKVSIGLSVVIRVTLKDGTYHEDIGYGGIENCKGKAMAFEKSKKEATTDALKRALRNFGNVLGNCIYDKEYINRVAKVKAGPTKFEVNDLHRHQDFAVKQEDEIKTAVQPQQPGHRSSDTSRTEFDDSFDVGDFDDVDFDESDLGRPDEVVITADGVPRSGPGMRPGPGNILTPSKPPQSRASAPQATGVRQPASFEHTHAPHLAPTHLSTNRVPTAQPPAQVQDGFVHGEGSSSPGGLSQHFAPQQASLTGQNPSARPAGFYSARAAENVDENNIPKVPVSIAKFNPHAESPSIRKTAGVDHNKSVPVKRDLLRPEPGGLPTNVPDSKPDSARKMGMPGQVGSVSGSLGRTGPSTSAYRPPTRHGSPAGPIVASGNVGTTGAPDRTLTAAKRHPLGDVSNIPYNANTIEDGSDSKRQRTSGPVDGAAYTGH